MNGGAEARRVFIGAGCNRVVNNVSWGACDLVAFGAHNAVAIFCPKVRPRLPFIYLTFDKLYIYSQTELFLSSSFVNFRFGRMPKF
jgi:hypothetical protein